MKGVIKGKVGQETYWIDGRRVSKVTFDRAFPDKPIGDGTGLFGWKPLASDGAAVHPNQVKEATEDARNKGVPTDFLPDGRPIFTSRTHRKNYLRAYGMFDRGAGYGDPAPNHNKEPDIDPRVYDVE